MKRMFVLTLVLTLVLALTLPAAAFAKRGGVPAHGNGKGTVASAPDESVSPEEAPADPGKVKKDKKKDKDVAGEDEGVEPGDDVDGETPDLESEPVDESAEKLTGIENALSRLQRNLARKQAAFEAGKAKGLPAGLQATIAKFMSWLGIDPGAEADDDEGSDETSGTVEPELPDGADDEDPDPEIPEVSADE